MEVVEEGSKRVYTTAELVALGEIEPMSNTLDGLLASVNYDNSGIVSCELIVYNNMVVNFDRTRISDYLCFGVHYKGGMWDVMGFDIWKPQYMSENVITSYMLPYLKASIIGYYPKWDGQEFMTLSVRSRSNPTLIETMIMNDSVMMVQEDRAPVICEVLSDTEAVVREGKGKAPVTAPLRGYLDVGAGMDGVIIVTDEAEYRVKKKRTYDFKCNGDKLEDSTGRVRAICHGLKSGSIYEVDDQGSVIRERPDKKYPLTPIQVSAIDSGVTMDMFQHTFPDLSPPPFVVTAHINKYVAMIARKLHVDKRVMWLMDRVRVACSEYIMPYSVEEIYGVLRDAKISIETCIDRIEESPGDLTVTCERGLLVIGVPQLRALTPAAFVQECRDLKSISNSAVKKGLWAKGFVFTPGDWRYLMLRFVRGQNTRRIYTTGGITIYLRPGRVVSYFGRFDSVLPYLRLTTRGKKNAYLPPTLLTVPYRRGDFIGEGMRYVDPPSFKEFGKLVTSAGLAELVNKGYRIDPLSVQFHVEASGRKLVGGDKAEVANYLRLYQYVNEAKVKSLNSICRGIGISKAQVLKLITVFGQLKVVDMCGEKFISRSSQDPLELQSYC